MQGGARVSAASLARATHIGSAMSLAIPTRRGFITGLVGLIAAPAIVRASSLMPVKAWPLERILGLPPMYIEGGNYLSDSVQIAWKLDGPWQRDRHPHYFPAGRLTTASAESIFEPLGLRPQEQPAFSQQTGRTDLLPFEPRMKPLSLSPAGR